MKDIINFVLNILFLIMGIVCVTGFIFLNFIVGAAFYKSILSTMWGGVKWLFGY